MSQPWMVAWIDAALISGHLVAACKETGVTLAAVHQARRSDAAFAEAYRLCDEVADLRVADSVRNGAAGGDPRSQALYFAKVRDVVLGAEEDRRAGDVLAPEVAEAMVFAGLEAAGALPRNRPGRPSPSSSRPRKPSSPESEGDTEGAEAPAPTRRARGRGRPPGPGRG